MSSVESAVGDGASAAPKSAGVMAFTKGYRAWMLIMLLLVNALNLADRQGMAATAPAIKDTLKLSDTQLGLIQGLGFAIFYTLLGLPLARMSERMNRARIVSVSIGIFGIMVAACGLAQNFWQFLLARVGVGIGDAGFGPPVASLIGDHYPARKRTSAMTVIWLGAPIGAVSGSVLGGWVAEHLGWRQWFFALGVPALVVAVIGLLTLREPLRGLSDGALVSGPPPTTGEVLKFLLAKPSVRWILIGGGLAATSMNALGQFFARFLVANFHLGYGEAGKILGMIAGISMASGLALGGFGMDWIGKLDRRWYVWGPAIGLVLAAPFFFFGANLAGLTATIIVLALGHVALFVYYTPTLAMAQNMVGSSMRASSALVFSVVLGLVGIGLGPTLVGFLSDFFAQRAFSLGDFGTMCPGGRPAPGMGGALASACANASALGIRHAIMAMSLLFVLAGFAYFMASFRLRQDLDTHYEPKS